MRECSLPSFTAQLADLTDGVSGLAVAFSGGLDSCVLLSLAHAWQQEHAVHTPLIAIHVNHGLSPHAAEWEVFCQNTCAKLGVELLVERVTIDRDAGPSLENLARERRYAAFQRHLPVDHGLLMAHHLDDQSETFLLRSLRGAGPRGLAAMPVRRRLGQGWLLRPLLGCPRVELERYAHRHQLRWIDDESNQSSDFDRNYLRHEVLPLLEARWPAYRHNWQRSAALARDADQLLTQLADLDLATIPHSLPPNTPTLDCRALAAFEPARQRNILRRWLQISDMPDPGYDLLQQIVNEVIPAGPDARPQVSWSSAARTLVLRRHAGLLHLTTTLVPLAADLELELLPGQTLSLPDNGTVALTLAGDALPQPAARFTVRYRRGGEQLRLQGRPTRSLKKILQEAGIPPWQRERLPLLFADDHLIAVATIGVAQEWSSLEFRWLAP